MDKPGYLFASHHPNYHPPQFVHIERGLFRLETSSYGRATRLLGDPWFDLCLMDWETQKGRPRASRGSSFRFLLMRRMVKGSVEESVELGRVGGAVLGPTFCILKEGDWCSVQGWTRAICMTSRVYIAWPKKNTGDFIF